MKQVRKYTKEFKQEAVNLALKSPSITQTAKELGIPMPTLHTWIQQLKGNSTTGEVKASEPSVAALLEENRRLHKENVILKEEKEILKKSGNVLCSIPEVKYEFIKNCEANQTHCRL